MPILQWAVFPSRSRQMSIGGKTLQRISKCGLGILLIIPKKPSYVLVTGQVLNSTAISYRPGKSAKWYLSQAGGPTQLADKKSIMVVRADGSVMGAKNGIWSGESFSAILQPGDTVVVPERVFTGGMQWQSIFSAAAVGDFRCEHGVYCPALLTGSAE